MKPIFIFTIMASAIFTSCKKEKPAAYNADVKAGLSIEFDNIVGSSDLQLSTGNYTNASGEAFKITTLKYFVSNFILTKTDGTIYNVPQDSCYFLVDENDPASQEPVLQVPEGAYAKISFVLGIDSLRNTMDISKRTGTLDPTGTAAGMYWSWNSGYIFLKIEGTSPASTLTGNIFQYHIGLFGGYTTPTINNLRMISLDLTARGTPKVKSGKSTNIHLMVDAARVFTGTSNISIAANAAVHGSANSAAIANNYASMFRHDHTEN